VVIWKPLYLSVRHELAASVRSGNAVVNRLLLLDARAVLDPRIQPARLTAARGCALDADPLGALSAAAASRRIWAAGFFPKPLVLALAPARAARATSPTATMRLILRT
jgi:hypothetical protein